MAKKCRQGMALLLAAMMMLSMAGCGGDKQPQPEQPQPEQEIPVEQGPEEPAPPVSEIDAPSFEQQIDDARAKNDDIVGWLKIDDLKIDGAVVQAKDNKY